MNPDTVLSLNHTTVPLDIRLAPIVANRLVVLKRMHVVTPPRVQANPPSYNRSEDLASLLYLNESSVMNCLRQRYGGNLNHTYAGPNMVVINPLSTPSMYSEKVRLRLGEDVFLCADQSKHQTGSLYEKPVGFLHFFIYCCSIHRGKEVL